MLRLVRLYAICGPAVDLSFLVYVGTIAAVVSTAVVLGLLLIEVLQLFDLELVGLGSPSPHKYVYVDPLYLVRLPTIRIHTRRI